MPEDTTKPKRSNNGDSTRKRIVIAARRSFFANGFRGVSMDDLARELGMSKRTLYEHFSSKTALVEAAILNKFKDIDAELEQITSAPSEFPDTLHRLLACIQQHTGEIQPPFIRDIRRQPGIFHHVERGRIDLVQRYLGKLLSRGRKSGVVREDVSAALIIEIILGALERIMNPQKMAELDITPKAGYSAIIAVVLEGVITEEGKSLYCGRVKSEE